MSLKSYEDFLELSVIQLKDFLAVRGLNVSGRKVELVAKAFSAVELGLEIIDSSEVQLKKLKDDYNKKISSLKVLDPNGIELSRRIDDLRKWPTVNLGIIFAYILNKKEFNTDYIGKYKDQKAYSYFDSGFVGAITVYEPKTSKNIVFLYCDVTASQAIHETKSLWLIIKKIDDNNSEILSAWCSCMAGSYECCNHIIATLYKIEYAHNKGWCKEACTDKSCQWNHSTRKEITPKRVDDIIIRKKTRSGIEQKDENTEYERAKSLQLFDPRLPCHSEISSDKLSELIRRVQIEKGNAVLFKSIESLSRNNDPSNYEMYTIDYIVKTINVTEARKDVEENKDTALFLKKLFIPSEGIVKIETNTRDQADCDLWHKIRKGRVTASKHHDIYTKMDTVARSTGVIKPKTTPLVHRVLEGGNSFANDATRWGINNETKAFKAFYSSQVVFHQDLKVKKCGIYIHQNKCYLAASPDGIAECKCHGISVIEIKCPYNIKSETISSGLDKCNFLKSVNGKIELSKTHKYYTQVTSQMAIAKTKQAFFVVWTTVDLFVEKLSFNQEHWAKVSNNLDVFYKAYIIPALLNIKPVTYCGKCNDVLLEEREIDLREEATLNSIQCESCQCWFHYKCELTHDADSEWICSQCINSMI